MKKITYTVYHGWSRGPDTVELTKLENGKLRAVWPSGESKTFKSWKTWISYFYNIAYYLGVDFSTEKNF